MPTMLGDGDMAGSEIKNLCPKGAHSTIKELDQK